MGFILMAAFITNVHRYKSLQRSFRRVQSERGNRGRGGRALSPILSPADPDSLSLSLTPEEVATINRTAPNGHSHSLTRPSTKPKKQRGSGKSGRWLFFGRRSNKHISQESTSNEDDILPITSPVGDGSIGGNLWFPGENLDLEDGERGSREASVGSEGGGVDSAERSRSMDRRRADAPSEERREREDNEEPLPHQQRCACVCVCVCVCSCVRACMHVCVCACCNFQIGYTMHCTSTSDIL